MKSLGISKIKQQIIDIVLKKYCDDKELAEWIQAYQNAKEKQEKRKQRQKPVYKEKTCKITEDVRKYLEPLVDAEYFKLRYGDFNNSLMIYKAMEQLKTHIYVQLIDNMEFCDVT